MHTQTMTTWSYSYFMYRLYEPFVEVVTNNIEELEERDIEKLLNEFLRMCKNLQNEMKEKKISFRQNMLAIQKTDTEYSYPDGYDFIRACNEFILAGGIIAFMHLDSLNVINKCLRIFGQKLAHAKHPLTGDSIWHLSPFLMDIIQVDVYNLYNYRGETARERRAIMELFNYNQVRRLPVDKENVWDEDTITYAEVVDLEEMRDPLTLCKQIKRTIKNK